MSLKLNEPDTNCRDVTRGYGTVYDAIGMEPNCHESPRVDPTGAATKRNGCICMDYSDSDTLRNELCRCVSNRAYTPGLDAKRNDPEPQPKEPTR